MLNCVADDTMQVLDGFVETPRFGRPYDVTGFDFEVTALVYPDGTNGVNFMSFAQDFTDFERVMEQPTVALGSDLGYFVRNTRDEAIPIDLWMGQYIHDHDAGTGSYEFICSLGRHVIAPTGAAGERRSIRIPQSCDAAVGIGGGIAARIFASLTPQTYYEAGEDRCAVNPPPFFYNAQTGGYDLAGYYSQRIIGQSLITLIGGYAHYQTILPESARMVEPIVSINTRPNRIVTMEIETDVAVVGDDPSNRYSWATEGGPDDPHFRVYGQIEIPQLTGQPARNDIQLGMADLPWTGTSVNGRATFTIPRSGRRVLMELPDAYEAIDLTLKLTYYVNDPYYATK